MPNVTPERLERRSLRQLLQGDPAKAEVAARKLIERSPQCASGWAALKGALTARGLPADADALRGCLASPPSAAAEGPIDLLASRRLSPRGLIFDPAEPVPLRRMAARLAQVRTAADLRETDNAVWFADRGGEWVERDPVLDLGDAAGPPVPVRYATAPKFLASIRNAAVVGEGLALTEAGEFLEELHPPFKASKYGARRHGDELMFEPAPRGRGQLSVKAFDTPAFLMAGPTDTSFGDFLVNFAPRLSLYEAAGLDCPILVRWKPLPQVLSILEALGFGADRVIFHTTDQISLFPKLFVSCWPSENKAAPVAGVFDIYRRASLAPTADRPLLYLDRRHVRPRPLANEEQVCELFAARGFQIVNPGNLTFEQTRRLFANPACVAGPFGSAFHNLVFSGNHPTSLVLIPAHMPYKLVEIAQWQADLGNRFAYVTGEMPAEPHNTRTPWTVSLDKLERALDRMMELVQSSQVALAG